MPDDRLTDPGSEFFVACLCAAWCGSCREYQPAFAALAKTRPDVGFVWVDVEDHAEIAGDVDVENFPTLVIQRGHDVLFAGPTLPEAGILARLLDSFAAQSPDESARYAQGSEERRAWQGLADVRSRLER
jgi:thiol-disulfide isomerase/thioredoxin